VRNFNNKRTTETKTFSRANKKRQLQLYGHVMMMAEDRKPRKILGARLSEKEEVDAQGKHGRM
jgi:hypothetical protein